tara:strand:- start:817 stop:1812 length:996 start_codon:yes stop_codon:yes gene_type:complete
MLSKARNHHFVAQVEQRLNAIDSTVSKKNQRIYSFQVNDRERYEIELTSSNGVKIEKNLSSDDLYSFDILNEKQRLNLEKAFGKYEQDVGNLTESLLGKLECSNADLKGEILEIFALKLLNTFRNPHCIEKTINIIGKFATVQPQDDELRELYKKIDNGNQPEKANIASEFSVTVEQYNLWIKSLFMILIPQTEQGINSLELILKNFFDSPDLIVNVFINSFSDTPSKHNVLLSDRGFSLSSNSEDHATYEFNLTSNAFINYSFTDIKRFAKDSFSPEQIQSFIASRATQPTEVKVHVNKDDTEALSRYNKNVVYQSYKNVYCKSKQVYGL